MRRFTIIALTTLLMAGPSLGAAPSQLQRAQGGDARAEYHVGMSYLQGVDVSKDTNESIKWFRRAAEQGDTQSVFMLGRIYEMGLGVPFSYGEALKWFRQAANQGDGGAALEMGRMYATGKGVKPDSVEAVRWYRLAAMRGNLINLDACRALSQAYSKGEGVPKDDVEALAWLLMAPPNFGPANYQKMREEMESRLTPQIILAATERSIQLLKEIRSR
jgi:uncharacterized protein